MRIIAAIAAASLAACGSADPPAAATNGAAAPEAGAPDNRIDCRVGGARGYERVCSVERSGPLLTIRKPDGGFRRLLATGDQRRVIAADGAEQARTIPLRDGRARVAIGGDEFLLPTSVYAR